MVSSSGAGRSKRKGRETGACLGGSSRSVGPAPDGFRRVCAACGERKGLDFIF